MIVVGDTPSSVEINALGAQWGPIQDGGRADTSAPTGSVSLWGVYVYYVYGCDGSVLEGNNGSWRTAVFRLSFGRDSSRLEVNILFHYSSTIHHTEHFPMD